MPGTGVTVEREALTLKVNEIFHSIQGEGSFALHPCAFIRLTGCNLCCIWCDTTYSFYEGESATLQNILRTVLAYNSRLVEVTGGEPLLQRNVYPLFSLLHDAGKRVLLETSGSLPIDRVPEFVHIILDLKAPGSGEEEKNRYENLMLMKSTDDLKIVVANRNDFEFAKNLVREHLSGKKLVSPPIIQPVFGQLEPAEVGEWIKESDEHFRLGVQLHKYIYEPTLRAV